MFSNGNFLIILLVLNQTSLILLSIAEPSTNSSLLFINKERNQQNFSYLQQENKQEQQQQQLKLKQYQKYSNNKNDIKTSNLSSRTANTTATTTNSPILLSSSTFSSLSPSLSSSLSSSTTTTTTTTDKREIINKVFSKNILKENHNNNSNLNNNNNKNVINNIQHTNTTRKSTTSTISSSTVKQQKYNDDDISVEKTIEDLSSIETLSFEKRGDSKSKLSKLSLESVPLPSLTSSSNSESSSSSSSSLPSELPGSSIKLSRQLHHQDRKLLRNQQLPSPQLSNINELPIFPERSDAVYFIVAIMGGAKTWSRIMARTLLEMGPPFGSPMGPPLRPLYVDLPASGGFSAKVLTSLCQQIENIPLAGVVVIGDGQSARAIALSGNAMQVPVLWARGGTANIHGIQREAQSALQSMLQPSAREILKAIRALFLQTHWHSFFVLADVDAAMVLAGNDGRTLKDPPLLPTILPLPAGDGDVFRQLAIISRSTRGIVLLLCNLISARKIMSEAKRLNMAGGHYIWLWADTSSTTEFFDLNHHKSTTLDETMLEYPEAVKEFTVVSSSSSSIPLSVSSSSSSSSQSSSSSSSNLYRQSIPSSSSISSPSSTILSSSEVSPLPDYDEDNISNMKNKNFHHKINNIGINGMNLNGDGISNENGFYNGDIKPKSFDESIDVVKGTTTGSTINFFNNIDKEKEVINMKKQKQHESRKNIQRQGETQRLPFQQNRFESKKFQQDSYEDADDAIATATVTTTSNKDYNTGEKDIIEEENDNTENIDDDVNDEKNLSSNGNDDDDNNDENLKKRQGYSQGPGRYVIGLYDDDNIDMSLELKKNKANRRYRQHTDDYYIDDDNNKDRMIQSKSDSISNSHFNINNNNKNRNSNSKISDKYYPTENPYLSLKNYNSMEMNENFDQYDDDDDDLIDTSMEEWFELPGNNWAQINNDTTSNLSPTILDNIDETSDLKLSFDSVENKNINNNQNDNNNNNKNINDNSNNNSGATPISNSNNKKIKNNNNNNNSNNSNNNNNNNNSNQKLKPKRTSFSEASHYIKNLTRSSDVLFHYFKDFPVGLLALRPVKMPVDRNFVRSTIRLFASTWARITFDNNLHNNINLSINNYQKNYINNINKNQNFRQYGTNIYDNYNWFASVNSRELIRDRLRNFFHTEYKRKRLRRNILIRSNFIKFNNLNSNHINNNNNNNYNSNNNNHYSNNNNKNRYIREINFNEIETVNKTINNNNNNKKNIKNNDNDENLKFDNYKLIEISSDNENINRINLKNNSIKFIIKNSRNNNSNHSSNNNNINVNNIENLKNKTNYLIKNNSGDHYLNDNYFNITINNNKTKNSDLNENINKQLINSINIINNLNKTNNINNNDNSELIIDDNRNKLKYKYNSSYNQNLSGLNNSQKTIINKKKLQKNINFESNIKNNNKTTNNNNNSNLILDHDNNNNNKNKLNKLNNNDNNNFDNQHVVNFIQKKQKRQNNNWWLPSTAKDAAYRFRSQQQQQLQHQYQYQQQQQNQQLYQQQQLQQLHQQLQQQQQQQMQKYQNLPNLNLITRNRASHYRGGCFGTSNKDDLKRSEIFAKALQEATQLALSGKRLEDGTLEKPLTTNFELLNLVPDDSNSNGNGGINNVVSVSNSGNGNNINLMFGDDIDPILTKITKRPENQLAKWRRVGIVSGTNVQLDTIVWPGGDVVVSGLSARARTTFRIVTALAPPFVMESEMDEDGLCLRGLPCHRLSPNSDHNLTLMFNAIETMYRLKEDAVEHGVKPPDGIDDDNYDHNLYNTKCCYGLSMDLLDNIATELGFEFHLYIVRDELFGTKYNNLNDFFPPTDKKINHRIINDDENIQTDAKAFKQQQHLQQQQQYQQQQKDHYTNRIHYPPPDSRNFQSGSFERNKNLNQNYNKDEDDVIVEDEDDYEDNINRANKDERKYDKQDIRRENYFDAIKGFQNGYRRSKLKVHWNGIVGDLISGSADMSFAPLTISKARAEVIDFSAPYFYSGVTLLAAPQSKSEIPLLAFLLPFSPELWIAIFTSLNVTAIAVAIYEWLSPFGLNPWGRQRSKNFSMSSALWVMWGLLCGHLVAFKAPKSWPNKFLINVWGGFSVIFIASYTANIAALIAGLFFHNASNRRSGELLEQRIGAPTASAAESFMKEYHHHMWEHMKKFPLKNIEEGIKGLKNGTLDLLLGDTAILDYYRATDHKCSLQKVGEPYIEDAYAIGMKKGFPLKDSISALIAKYSSNGYLDILTEKWYGGLPCYQLDNDIVMPRPLGVEAVAGVFLLLGLGVILGVLILIFEHLFFKYTLPLLRLKPKGSVWRSRNIMFFSQKLYRFINCVELVSPHHAARELVHTLRQGQIASLFQKSIKRKEDEQRRRRRSKAQFFEMIQEIRRVQQAEKMKPKLEVVSECTETTETALNPEIPEIIEPSLSPKISPKPRLSLSPKPRSSPMQKLFRNNNTRSRSNSSTLNVRRFSTDSILSERLDTIGRRLSRDLTNSPPDFGKRYEVLANKMSASNISGSSGGVSDTYKKYDTMGKKHFSDEKLEETKFNSLNTKNNISEKNISATIPSKKHQLRRTPLNSDTFSPQIGKSISTSTSKDELMKKDSNTTSSTGSISKKNKSELPVDLLQPSIGNDDKIKTKIIQRSKENLLSKNSNDSISCTDETEQSSQQQPLYTSIKIVEKRPVHRSSSSQTCSIGYRSSRPTKRSNQNLHHRQRSLDNLDSRPPMPLPIEATSVSRPQSRDKIDYNKDDNNINDNNDDDDDDDDDDIRTIYIRQTDINLPIKISPLRRNLNDSNEFKKISLDRLSREDLLKLSETSQTEIHEYLSKPKPTDYTDKPP